eukprot:jgi/Phyca11/534456/estExt2_fgenesh1_pg.C_PHYCAscaffold_240009
MAKTKTINVSSPTIETYPTGQLSCLAATHGTFLIEYKDSYFAYSQMDLAMTGGSEVVEIIQLLNLSVTPLELAEAKKGIETASECVTKWAVEGHLRLFMFQAVKNSIDYSSIPAADFNVYPEYADCRPVVPTKGLTGEKLALATAGEDLVAVVPDILKLFPFSFTSSLPAIAREVATTSATVYNVKSVTQSLFRGYYGGCRVNTVNSTGVYIEDSCTIVKHWANYGLMLQAPDDIPVCTTGSDSICIHNYYNSLWEWVTGTDETPNRALMKISVFRNRYADTVDLSVLPGMVTVQMLLMGIISLYQIMSHKQSVLLTQIWAYRCQNGRMQVLYLAQVTYHLIYNSDFWIVDYNGQLLRKTTVLGKKYCGLHDSCFLMNVNLAVVVAVISSLLGLVALSASYFVQKRYGKKLSSVEAPTPSKKVAIQAKGANRYLVHSSSLSKFGKDENKQETVEDDTLPPLTTFEENCLGSPFTRLFKDCDDFATVTYMGKRCTSVEALLLTGYLFYGQHVYQAGSVVLLLLARLIPRKLLRTFNVLLIRWYMDPDNGRLTHALSCTWFAASAENYKISEATPVA